MNSFNFLVIFSIILHQSICKEPTDDVLVYTVATDETEGFQRYLTSAREYGIEPMVLGMGEKWLGGDEMHKKPGGGWKVNLLREALEHIEKDAHKIILFTDAYDVVFLNGTAEILRRFKASGARILFSAEALCWPDQNLKDKYPEAKFGYRFLNSGMYIGYVPELLQLLRREKIADTDDDQLFFTRAYLDEEFRKKVQMKLDNTAEIFQNLNGAKLDVDMFDITRKDAPEYYIMKNSETSTRPVVIHGNGPSKTHLNSLSNYLFNSWNSVDGCKHCQDRQMDLENKKPEEMPTVMVALFVTLPTPFLEEYFEKIQALEYPKNKIHLFVYNSVKYHTKNVTTFLDKHGAGYLSLKQIKPEDSISEFKARDLSLDQCLLKECEYYFSVDSVAHLDNPHTLRLLIEQNRTIVAPLLVRPGRAWSNFWGALTADGYYARSGDYMDIVHGKKRGLWDVPFIANSYLINGTLLRKYDRSKLSYDEQNLDSDMAFCKKLRELDVHMYVSNRVDFGHLVNPETFDITRTEPDMYQIFDNEVDWEARYIHPDYPENFNPDKKPKQPCPDVYWFPIGSRRFCDTLINMMESFGKWSDGKNEDTRLEGGYEAVPTRDIHMTQVGFDSHWLHFLHKYVRPLQEHVFTGYYHDPPRSLMNFVVRYRPDEQPSLRPHHDSSTYTINIALNERGVDYEGGGCRFIRYNCSVVDTQPGWMLIHPGRLTHYHEGLLVTKGTRYIMISFVDP